MGPQVLISTRTLILVKLHIVDVFGSRDETQDGTVSRLRGLINEIGI